ncbi:hypothetical protein COCON_G00227880 [Conger conger]|uniref:Uncharacterized protein n=1 Tax=Conger conger TaxID=82655 RepID=A0A9Q1HLN1_CONCO|nr:hypothetical protein COCON_G00227880 [Conger conger]
MALTPGHRGGHFEMGTGAVLDCLLGWILELPATAQAGQFVSSSGRISRFSGSSVRSFESGAKRTGGGGKLREDVSMVTVTRPCCFCLGLWVRLGHAFPRRPASAHIETAAPPLRMLGMCRGRRKLLAASLALLFIPALTWLYLSAANFQVKAVPLSALVAQAPSVGGLWDRLALESRVREVEEENRALRRELSRPARPARHHGNHGNHTRSYSTEEGTGDSDA